MKLRYLAAVGVAATLALTACGSGGSNQSGKSPSSGAQGTAPLTIAKPDGPIAPENNNPWVGTAPAATLGYINAIYEPLAIVNLVDPSAKVQDWLASDVSWSSDYKSVTLTARGGVTWSDGKPFTAADIAFTFDFLKQHPELDANALGIVSATSSGNKATITFQDSMYTKQDKVLMEHIVPQHVWSKVSNPDKYTNPTPVGTGPYTLSHFSSQGVQLKARSDYWGGTPAVPTLNYVSYNDNTALTTALADGDADWAQAVLPNVQTAFVDKNPSTNHYWPAADLGDDVLYVNTTKAPFDNVAFRKALNDVIDRTQYAKIARWNSQPPLTSVTGLPSPAGDAFVSAALKGQDYQVDAAAAKKTLTAAGYSYQGSTLIDPSGQPVTFTISDPEGWSDYVTGISLIAKAAQSIGAKVNVTTPDADTWTTDIANGNFQASEHWTDTGATPFNIFDDIMDGSWLKPIGQTASYNFGRYKNPQASAALKQYANATSDAQRTAAMATIQKIFVDDVPAMPVGMRPSVGEFDSADYVGWPSASNPYANPDPTQPSAIEILMHLKPAK